MRWLLRALGAGLSLLLLAALLVGAGVAALLGGWQRDAVRDALARAASLALGARVELAALEGPRDGWWTLRGLVVSQDDGPVLAVERVSLRARALDWEPAPRLHLEALEIDAPELRVRRRADGSFALGTLLGGGEGGGAPPLGVAIDRLRLDGLHVTVEDAAAGSAPWRLSANGSAIDLAWPAEPGLHDTARQATLRDTARQATLHDTARQATLHAVLDGAPGGASGELTLALADGALSAELAAAAPDLAAFAGLLPADAPPLRGGVQLTASLAWPRADAGAWPTGVLDAALRDVRVADTALGSGALALASDAPGRFAVRGLRLAGGVLPLEAEPGAHLSFEAGALRVEALALAVAGGRVAADGAIAADGFRGLRVSLEGIEPARLAEAFGSAERPAGRLAARLRLDGPFEAPALEGDARWRAPVLEGGWRAEELALAIRSEPRAVVAAGTLALSDRVRLEVAAELPRRLASWADPLAEPGTRLSAASDSLDLADLRALFPDALPDATGRVAGRLAVRGGAAAPALEGALEWRDGALALEAGQPPLAPIEATLRVGGGRVEVDRLQAGVAGARFSATGSIALAGFEPGALDLHVQLEAFELAALVGLLPPGVASLRGTVTGSFQVKGEARAPELAGALQLRGGAVGVPLLGQTLEPVEGEVALAPGELRVERLVMGPPEARAALGGRVALDGLAPERFDLSLSLEHFALARSPVARADASGELTLRGPVSAAALEGAIALEKVEVHVPEPEDPVLKEIRVVASPTAARPGTRFREEEAEPPRWLADARADLEIRVPRGTWLRAQDGELEVAGEFAVRKQPGDEVRYEGEVRALRGQYSVYGKRFQIREGTATLEGSERLDPRLDVEAVHAVSNVKIVARIEGPASDPTIRLYGEPAMSDADALSYLLMGRPTDQVSGNQQASLEAAGALAATGIAAGALTNLLQNVLPVDTLDIGAADGETGGHVGVGKQITDRIYVYFDQTLGTEPVQAVRVQLRISDEWSLTSELTSGDAASAGADLIWQRDY